MDFPQFLAPQTKTMGGGEVTEQYATASAASDHSAGMDMFGDRLSVSENEVMAVCVAEERRAASEIYSNGTW